MIEKSQKQFLMSPPLYFDDLRKNALLNRACQTINNKIDHIIAQECKDFSSLTAAEKTLLLNIWKDICFFRNKFSEEQKLFFESLCNQSIQKNAPPTTTEEAFEWHWERTSSAPTFPKSNPLEIPPVSIPVINPYTTLPPVLQAFIEEDGIFVPETDL